MCGGWKQDSGGGAGRIEDTTGGFEYNAAINPDSASYVIGARTQLRFRAGDALLWTAFPSLAP